MSVLTCWCDVGTDEESLPSEVQEAPLQGRPNHCVPEHQVPIERSEDEVNALGTATQGTDRQEPHVGSRVRVGISLLEPLNVHPRELAPDRFEELLIQAGILESVDAHTPRTSDVLLCCVRIVEEQGLWVSQRGPGVEDGRVCRDRDCARTVILGGVGRFPLVMRTQQGDRRNALAIGSCLDLVSQLHRGTDVRDPLAKSHSSPLGDE